MLLLPFNSSMNSNINSNLNFVSGAFSTSRAIALLYNCNLIPIILTLPDQIFNITDNINQNIDDYTTETIGKIYKTQDLDKNLFYSKGYELILIYDIFCKMLLVSNNKSISTMNTANYNDNNHLLLHFYENEYFYKTMSQFPEVKNFFTSFFNLLENDDYLKRTFM